MTHTVLVTQLMPSAAVQGGLDWGDKLEYCFSFAWGLWGGGLEMRCQQSLVRHFLNF